MRVGIMVREKQKGLGKRSCKEKRCLCGNNSEYGRENFCVAYEGDERGKISFLKSLILGIFKLNNKGKPSVLEGFEVGRFPNVVRE